VKIALATRHDIGAAPQNPPCVLSIIVTTKGARSGAHRFANYYGLKLDTVAAGPNFGFRYENIVVQGMLFTAKAGFATQPDHTRKCSACGDNFDPVADERLCPFCHELIGI